MAKAHKAHIMVAVLGEEEKLLERGKLFTKAMAVCCKQKYATGVYTSGVVFEPRSSSFSSSPNTATMIWALCALATSTASGHI